MGTTGTTLAAAGVKQPLSELLSEIGRYTAAADESGTTHPEALNALRYSGYLGAMIPAEFGGLGQDSLFASRFIQQLASVDPSMAIIAFQHMSVISRILEWGTELQRRTYLPLLASGEWIAASAWSESGAGANKMKLATVASPLGEGRWRIDGAKTFTTGAGLADLYFVLVQTGANDQPSMYGSKGQTFFLIETTKGITANSDLNLSGMRGSSTGFIDLQHCVVTSDHVVGSLGSALEVITGIRECGLTLGAISVGISQAAFQLALEHVQAKGLESNPLVQSVLSELHMWIEAAVSLVDKVAARQGDQLKAIAYQSKVFASEISEKVCREVQQLIGGTAYIRGREIERLGRDARAVALMGPVNHLAKEIVGREIIA